LLGGQEEGKLIVNDKLSKYLPDFSRGDEATLPQIACARFGTTAN
jgi:CubicO group peptidase (beta-lactamase class C family)